MSTTDNQAIDSMSDMRYRYTAKLSQAIMDIEDAFSCEERRNFKVPGYLRGGGMLPRDATGRTLLMVSHVNRLGDLVYKLVGTTGVALKDNCGRAMRIGDLSFKTESVDQNNVRIYLSMYQSLRTIIEYKYR